VVPRQSAVANSRNLKAAQALVPGGLSSDLDLERVITKVVAGAGLDWSRLAAVDGLMPRNFNRLAAPPA
jgi:hypothetical protein